MIYDGVSWRVKGIPQFARVRSLAIDDETGIIYIGGVGEIGYLEADEKGALKYKPLMDQLKEEHRNFSDIWEQLPLKREYTSALSNFCSGGTPKANK